MYIASKLGINQNLKLVFTQGVGQVKGVLFAEGQRPIIVERDTFVVQWLRACAACSRECFVASKTHCLALVVLGQLFNAVLVLGSWYCCGNSDSSPLSSKQSVMLSNCH